MAFGADLLSEITPSGSLVRIGGSQKRIGGSHGAKYSVSARICLTHSFPYKNIGTYNGQNDCSEEETEFIQNYIDSLEYNDYDRLIQLCDAISFPDGPTYIEKRLVDVVMRRGFNDLTIPKWKAFLELKKYFDEKTGMDIYTLLDV